MCHLTNLVVCSRDEQKKEYLTSGRQKKPGRPRECRTCDAGLSDGPRMEKNVVYSMYCSICDGLYVSLERPKGELEIALSNIIETQRPTKALRPWGVHYHRNHGEAMSATMDPLFTPFVSATILGRELSLHS